MKPWLSLIGIGEDGAEALSPAAKRLIAGAELVVGGKRHLALAGDFAGEALPWPSPLTDAFPAILARRGRPVAVLASGDPFFHGVGSTLTRKIDADEMVCLPAPSAFSLAAARLGWAQQDCTLLSLHGHALERIIPHLQPGARILALSWDETTPKQLAALLTSRRMGGSRLVVCEAMGGPRERLTSARADAFALSPIDPLNTVGIEVTAEPGADIVPLAAGLADEMFEHDGQITKRDIRAMTLAALSPRRGELLWDVGAGAGSVAIEWMLADPSMRAVAIEAQSDRAGRIRRNAAAFGVPGLEVIEGAAPAAFEGLARPDAVFVGGGATIVLDMAVRTLRAGGRLVVNAVTVETEALLLQRRAMLGGELKRIAIARAEPMGGKQGWRPALPVTQWVWIKP
jgi:precorrin-6B C5,15-methyltransferase / cobalt-precorrin-6B C5,C15-methyltransferase